MTTTTQATEAIKAQIASAGITFTIYWKGDPAPILPDTPSLFGYAEFNNEGSGGRPAAFGGGRGNNLYRNRAFLEVFVFAPDGQGQKVADDAAELVSAALRSFRSADISCFAADTKPIGPGSNISVPGLTSVVSSYSCSVSEATITFDLIG